jgi:hypothetical protein
VTRTPTLPPDDKQMWRRLLARVHPDAGGAHELFIWTSSVRDEVCGEGTKNVAGRTFTERREQSEPAGSGPDRIPFDTQESFDLLTRRILNLEFDEPYASLIMLLADCHSSQESTLYRQQYRGATYKQLAYVAHLAGMSQAERTRWYRITESLPLSQRHAGHILKALQAPAA